jgi:predicted permease
LTLPRDFYDDSEKVVNTLERLVERARELPGVQQAAISSQVPMGPGGGWNGLIPEGKTLKDIVHARLRIVSSDYFVAMGIPLSKGQVFRPTDRRDSEPVIVLSEALAKAAFGGEDALGKRISCCNESRHKLVIGIVGDVRSGGLGAKIEPEFYLPIAQAPATAWDWIQRTITFALKAEGPPENLVAALKAKVRSVDTSLPLHGIATMEQRVFDSLAQPIFLTALILTMAILGLTIASLGVHGMMEFLTSRRRHEIGVRTVLGAAPQDVTTLMMKQIMTPIATGVVLGFAGTLAGVKFLSSQLYGMRTNDLWTFLAVAAVVCIVALTAGYIPARRIARVPPRDDIHPL